MPVCQSQLEATLAGTGPASERAMRVPDGSRTGAISRTLALGGAMPVELPHMGRHRMEQSSSEMNWACEHVPTKRV